ncbi:MAG TPA: PDZ domain-containing protein [Planctomycetota bacterium]|jgi:hypothetical protein|nr:PDZ domain-containing protein [Planctomycetota bacterium]
MNIGQIKILSWGAAGLLTTGLGLYVAVFVRDLESKRKPPDAAKIQAALEAAEPAKPKAADLVPYEDIRRLFLPSCEHCKENPHCRHLNWTGKPPPPPAAPTNPDVDVKPPVVAIAELVRIGMIQADLSDSKLSRVWLKYRPKASVQNNAPAGGFLLREGDHLVSPYQYARIETINSQAVVFAFDDANREAETITPDEFDLKSTIVQVDPDGVIMPKITGIPRGSQMPWRPNKTTEFGQNKFMLGLEDVAYANDNYAKILAEDIRTGRHQDARTGKYDGIEIQAVSAGSFAERHGAQEGDIIKSVNGHPVTSVQDAINYAKMNANQFTTWEIVIERNGKLQTFYYHSPQQ